MASPYADDLSWMWWRKPPTTRTTLPVAVQTKTNGGSTNGDLDWMWWRTPPTVPTGGKGLFGWKNFLKKKKVNPLSDTANWETGGRQPVVGNGNGNGNGNGGNMMWMYAGGALLVAVLLMRKKK
jgi:hypothetical protein